VPSDRALDVVLRGIGLAFVVVGHALERALHFAGRPTRWAWVIALAGSYVVPIAAWVRPDAFATFAVPIPVVAESAPSVSTFTTSTNLDQPPPSAFSLVDLDPALRWGWILASGGMLVALTLATARLLSMRRRWRRSVVDGRDVLVSSDVGPAVVGWWSPRVVLPEWTLALPDAERELMLAHEEQHVRAADPALLAAALVTVLVAPWNLALWLQWRRLRLAVEIDCDARVLAQGRSPAAYGELLLHVGGRRNLRMFGVAAFGEPRSFLESRIRRMLAQVPRWRWAGVAIAVSVALGAIVGACEAPRPLIPQAMAQEPIGDRNAAPQAAWVRDNLRQFFPTLGDANGPALDAYLIHDAQLRVYQGTLTQRGRAEIGATELKRVFAAYDRGRDGWGMVDRRDLKGLVRDNVRVFWLHHDPQPQDTLPSLEERLNATMEQAQHTLEQARQIQPDMDATRARLDSVRSDLTARLEQMRENEFVGALKDLARASEPAAFAGNRSAVAVIVDADKHLIAHASGSRQAENESCGDVLTRLLPAYKNVRFPTSGCILVADNQSQVIVYWGQLPRQ
jgi:beta-lactamase regulating signal transducer with metallopeptidase domain